MQRKTLGTLLHSADREAVLRTFVHRFTREHRPEWARCNPNYTAQFADDADWLAHSYFYVKRDGRLDERFTHCTSFPTWPDGQGAWGSPAAKDALHATA